MRTRSAMGVAATLLAVLGAVLPPTSVAQPSTVGSIAVGVAVARKDALQRSWCHVCGISRALSRGLGFNLINSSLGKCVIV